MTSIDLAAGLSARPRVLLADWLPGARIVRDHSWGLVARTVLEVEHDGTTYVVKAGGPDDHHMRGSCAPTLVHHDDAALLVVTRFLPGQLVEGSAAAEDPEVHGQAGILLALLHDHPAVVDEHYRTPPGRSNVPGASPTLRYHTGRLRVADEARRGPGPAAVARGVRARRRSGPGATRGRR